jgi:hypothetical protein
MAYKPTINRNWDWKTSTAVVSSKEKRSYKSKEEKQKHYMQPSVELGAVFGVYVPTSEEKQVLKEQQTQQNRKLHGKA